MGEKLATALAPVQPETEKRLKIAYLCTNDPMDKRSWSGITYYVGQALQRNVGEVDFIGPVKPSKLVDKALRAIAKITRAVFGKEYNVKHSILLSWHFGRQLKKRIGNRRYDCIVAPAAATDLAFFKPADPVIYFSDTTFELISNFYVWEYGKIPAFSRWEGNFIERRALRKSSGVIVSSNWAANSVIKDYGIPKERILIMPLGANIDFVPPRERIFQKIQNNELTLLYLAVEWERKGGPIAFETLLELHRRGIKAKLIVCGCVPPTKFRHSHLHVIPFLNKNNKADHDLFVQLLSSVHFLLLPTRADCSLLVACESNSYGVPAIATAIGGVPDVVKDGVNGYCLPFEAKGPAYADKIEEIYADPAFYRQLIIDSRKRFEERLNWDVWSDDFRRLYKAIAPK